MPACFDSFLFCGSCFFFLFPCFLGLAEHTLLRSLHRFGLFFFSFQQSACFIFCACDFLGFRLTLEVKLPVFKYVDCAFEIESITPRSTKIVNTLQAICFCAFMCFRVFVLRVLWGFFLCSSFVPFFRELEYFRLKPPSPSSPRPLSSLRPLPPSPPHQVRTKIFWTASALRGIRSREACRTECRG